LRVGFDPEAELTKGERFHQERVKRDMPKISMKGNDQVNFYKLEGLSDGELEQLSKKQLWALHSLR